MKMVGVGKQVSCGIIDGQQARRAVADVEDEMPGSVGSIGDEGGASCVASMGGDRRNVRAEPAQSVYVQLAEIVPADGPDKPRWLTKRCRLANEDRWRAGWERPHQWPGFEKALAGPIRHISTRISPAETSFFITASRHLPRGITSKRNKARPSSRQLINLRTQ